MGSTHLLQHHQSVRWISSFSSRTSSPITTGISNHQPYLLLPPEQNVREPMRELTLKRITAATNPFIRFNQPKLFCAINFNNNNSSLEETMSDKANKNDYSQSGSGESAILNVKKEEEKKLEKSTLQNIPPPPEKPLPDDCCGSGCVRCVWDIYYEELEAYNKLYKTSPDSKSNISKAS